MSDYLRELANEERKEKEHEAHYVARLEAKLAEVTAADRATRIALLEVETALIEVEAALAASQAHAVELRAAGKELEELLDTADLPNGASLRRLRTALTRESSTDALREFGLKVARATRDNIDPRSSDREVVALVDAVLKGDTT